MNEPPRRRKRADPNAPRDGRGTPWLTTLIAAIVVIAIGWFLGQGLAHLFGTRAQRTAAFAQPSAPPLLTAAPSPTAPGSPTAAPSPSAVPSATAPPSPSAEPSATEPPSPSAVPSATLAPVTPSPKHTPAPMPSVRPSIARVHPVAAKRATPMPIPPAKKNAAPAATTAPPAVAANPAEQTVLAYIDALKSGDPQKAALYLGNGTPDEGFIDAATRISSLTSTRNDDGSYKVEADMQTAQGEYYETFQVASSATGDRILDKTAIKP